MRKLQYLGNYTDIYYEYNYIYYDPKHCVFHIHDKNYKCDYSLSLDGYKMLFVEYCFMTL